jgi:[ribosomal protein S5]-alanine N-acetyltransferase
MLTIRHPTLNDADALLAFEIDNRAYFEHWINARPADYYSLEAVQAAIAAAQADIGNDRAYQYLVCFDDAIVGRVNLVDVTRPYFNRATLGYRIGQQCAGQGYASQAVALALEAATRDLRLSRIEAVVRPQNAGSTRVLERNGFSTFGRASRSMYFQGEWHDLLHFERHLHGAGDAPATGPASLTTSSA